MKEMSVRDIKITLVGFIANITKERMNMGNFTLDEEAKIRHAQKVLKKFDLRTV